MYNELLKNATRKLNRPAEDFTKFFSPGRINLIGEHVDYNGGYVLPCPLDFGTIAVAAKSDSKKVRCYSENFEEVGIVEFDVDDIKKDPKEDWVSFVKGVMLEMIKDGHHFDHGFDFYIKGNIPNGAGLSSSASLELLIGVVLTDFFNLKYNAIELSLIGQRCEHNYIGVNCGIMDQFIIGMGQPKKAILLKTDTLKYEYVNANFEDNVIVIGNTNYRRTLADSKYNERRSECEKGLEVLKQYVDISNLCDLTVEEFERLSDKLEPTIRKRVRHVVSENQRTKDACKYLEAKDFGNFGRLLNESHNSLRDDYEVTGPALDNLVNAFRDENILGARMTGAGFGGCMIALVNKDLVDGMLDRVNQKYFENTGLRASFYIARVGEGARKVETNE